VIEDRTRRLPRLERILHTLLAINVGAILAAWAPELLYWGRRADRFAPIDYGLWSWLLSVAALCPRLGACAIWRR